MYERTFALRRPSRSPMGPNLMQAIKDRRRPWMRDRRDEPGTDEEGICRLDSRYDDHQMKHLEAGLYGSSWGSPQSAVSRPKQISTMRLFRLD
jgi:hypothetical protein